MKCVLIKFLHLPTSSSSSSCKTKCLEYSWKLEKQSCCVKREYKKCCKNFNWAATVTRCSILWKVGAISSSFWILYKIYKHKNEQSRKNQFKSSLLMLCIHFNECEMLKVFSLAPFPPPLVTAPHCCSLSLFPLWVCVFVCVYVHEMH